MGPIRRLQLEKGVPVAQVDQKSIVLSGFPMWVRCDVDGLVLVLDYFRPAEDGCRRKRIIRCIRHVICAHELA